MRETERDRERQTERETETGREREEEIKFGQWVLAFEFTKFLRKLYFIRQYCM